MKIIVKLYISERRAACSGSQAGRPNAGRNGSHDESGMHGFIAGLRI